MQITETGFYRMRNGEIAEVECISKYGDCNRVIGGSKQCRMQWSEGGYLDNVQTQHDLVEYIGKTLPKRKVTKTIEKWVNVYPEEMIEIHDTEIGANKYAESNRIACVKVTGTYEVEE